MPSAKTHPYLALTASTVTALSAAMECTSAVSFLWQSVMLTAVGLAMTRYSSFFSTNSVSSSNVVKVVPLSSTARLREPTTPIAGGSSNLKVQKSHEPPLLCSPLSPPHRLSLKIYTQRDKLVLRTTTPHFVVPTSTKAGGTTTPFKIH